MKRINIVFIFLCLFIKNIFATFNTTTITTNEAVDLNRFTQLLSSHLLFDHFDKAYSQLSKKISVQFRSAIHVKVKRMPNSQKAIVPVDVQILKRQLKGAVGSFIEDKLPSILSTRYNTSNLQSHLDNIIYEYCADTISTDRRIISESCILEHQHRFLVKIENYMTQQVQEILYQVNEFDLPRLFEKTRAQISGILIHFNQHIMDPLHHRLELKQKQKGDSKQWITDDMLHEFVSIVSHAEDQEDNNIQHFINLSK
ncbi:hypothetical protein BCV72DRAFT_252419 [Rhizopus microsporus var. microsporus]|uniref:Uncharacterized protein n=1 Tax=Rhizopus microsporus var. microsporus TaxID=86635 RepID=A0A1X0QS19_RHIZD|nr:hypothetical protein BCV72DRAFT_252419 [Rhizopus microsporus var. microsporus]